MDFTADSLLSRADALLPVRPDDDVALLLARTNGLGGRQVASLRRARVFDEGGRGLLLVAQLAERWGTRHARHGKTVWAELDDSARLSVPAFI